VLTGFLDRIEERRIVFARGDYIEYGQGSLGQIKEICLHEHTDLEPVGRRLFALVRPVQPTGERDKVLDLPIVEPAGSDVLVGLPSITAKKLYIINIGDVDECLVWVDWNIQFL
jgi:hypothetical protein